MVTPPNGGRGAEKVYMRLVGKTGNDERKERDRQMVIGRRARASALRFLSRPFRWRQLRILALRNAGTSDYLFFARTSRLRLLQLICQSIVSCIIWNTFLFLAPTAISGKTISRSCDPSHCGCDMHYWRNTFFFTHRGKYFSYLHMQHIDTIRNVYRTKKFASANVLSFVALRRAISCNHGGIKGDVTES